MEKIEESQNPKEIVTHEPHLFTKPNAGTKIVINPSAESPNTVLWRVTHKLG